MHVTPVRTRIFKSLNRFINFKVVRACLWRQETMYGDVCGGLKDLPCEVRCSAYMLGA